MFHHWTIKAVKPDETTSEYANPIWKVEGQNVSEATEVVTEGKLFTNIEN